MANNVKVTVTDSAGGKTVRAELPTTATMTRLLPALVTKMELPTRDQSGAPVGYLIQHKQSGKELKNDDTLASAGVQEGDTLRLLPNMVPGCSSLQKTRS